MFALGFTISLASELTGTSTGYPFGPYSYTTLLGYRIGGLVPFNIPTSWFYMLYASLAICGRVLRADDGARTKLRWAAVAGVVLTAWDVSMDPAMVRTNHWTWHLPPPEQQSPLQRVFVSDAFYGMPIANWLGWLLTGTIVARAMLAVVPPTAWARLVAPTRFPLVLYAVNGILPVTICARYGMWWAAALGAAAMIAPLVLAARAGRDAGRRAAVSGP
jgi:putative membrane protein